MPRDSNGTYTLPAGNPVVGGTVISATVHNNTQNDVAAELTDSLSRSGKGGMLAPFEFDDGLVGAPAATFSSETNSGLYRSGANDIRFSLAGADLVQFSTALIKFISHVTDGASAVGLAIDTVNALSTSGAKLLRLLNNAVEKFFVDRNGNIQGGGVVQALGPTTVALRGNMPDDASAVGVCLDNAVAMSTAGAKICSFLNGAVEKAYVDKGGGCAFVGGLFTAMVSAVAIATSNTNGLHGTGDGVAEGVVGLGGSNNGHGVSGVGGGTGHGVRGQGGSSGGYGVAGYGQVNGYGLYGLGAGAGGGLYAAGGSSGPGADFVGSSSRAPISLNPQAAPSAPQNGDMWVETGTNTLKVRINGVTKTVTLT